MRTEEKGEKLDDQATLRTKRGGNESWTVSVKGGLMFHVHIFDPTACEKVYPLFDVAKDDQKMGKANTNEKKKNVGKGFLSFKGNAMVKPVEDPQFKITMKTSHFKWWTVCIPADFGRENGLGKRREMMTLEDPKGRSWEVQLSHRRTGGLVFHVLMFDHTESERVYPSLDDQKMKKANTIEKMNNKMNEKVAKEFHGSKGKSSAKRVEDPPQFTVTLQPRHLNWQTLTVDQNFARENGLTNRRRMITLRDPKGKLWKVRLNHKESSGKVYFQSGWPEFRDGHKLKAEDGCTFKLVSKGFKNIVIEVSISR
ncbi:hypothetical protein IFM89_027243 [Coptis chinensis]|uniref:TF-B3 domain-containing protein n=1 Tax=Coptis chinensis TaxID=261450 RepID=A0A835I7K6_9MAGN|nr:hypothetical protein IFM89_027243 [Coptis chinensis]